MTSSRMTMLMMAAITCHVIALSHAWYLEGAEAAPAPNPSSDGGDYSSALEEMASDEDQAAVAPQPAGEGRCSSEKLIALFGQLLVSEYNRQHEIASENLFIISSDIWNQCSTSSNLCAVYFNVSPTRCIPTTQDPTICNVIISSEGKRRCHATVDLVEGVVRNPLACQLTRGGQSSSSSGSSRQLAKLLASMVSDKEQEERHKRWGQMHGHVHPF